MHPARFACALLVAFVACTSSRDETETKQPEDPSTGASTSDDGGGHPATTGATDAALAQPDASRTCVANQPAVGAVDIEVTIDASRGPHGGAPAKVDRRIHGMNVADWRPDDYDPAPSSAFATLLRALRPGVLRWPAGHRSQEYVWARGGGGQSGDWTLEPSHIDAFMALASSVGAEPAIALNVKRSTPAAMADLASYLNVDKKYGVKWFLVGNEPDLTDGIIGSPQEYASKLAAWASAIRAVDPNARFIAPELLTGAHVNGINGTVNWLGPILQQAGSWVDGVSWHYYPLDSAQELPTSSAIMTVPHLFQESAPDWPPASIAYVDEVMPFLATTNKGVWITEFAEDPGPAAGTGISDTIAGALWVGDAFGRYAEYAPDAIVRWLFKSPEHGYSLLDEDNTARPSYGAHWLYARHMGDRFVAATSSVKTEVAVHASLRPDGALAVMLVNKTTSAKKVHLTVDGFCLESARDLSLEGSGYGAKAFTVNGQTLSSANAETLAASPAAQLYETELPPTSLRVVVYR